MLMEMMIIMSSSRTSCMSKIEEEIIIIFGVI